MSKNCRKKVITIRIVESHKDELPLTWLSTLLALSGILSLTVYYLLRAV